MRCSQNQWLTQTAIQYIIDNAEFKTIETINRWNKKNITEIPVSEVYDTTGMFDDVNLYKYKCKDGSWIEEFVQASPWSSGPVIFIALRHNNQIIGEWPKSVINKV